MVCNGMYMVCKWYVYGMYMVCIWYVIVCGCMDVWMYGCKDVWMDGCMYVYVCMCMYVCMCVSLSVACTGCNIGMIYILFVESSHVRSLVIIQWSIGVNPLVSGVCLVRGWDYFNNTRLKFSKIQKCSKVLV